MSDAPLASLQITAVRPDRAEERATAVRVFAGALERHAALVCRPGRRPESGRSDGERWYDERWFLKSRATRVHLARAPALAALDRLFEDKCALGELAPSRTILILTADGGERFQIWTLAPRMTSLREALDAASAAGAWDRFGRVLADYCVALGAALGASLEAGLCLDAAPANFASQWGRIRYLADDIEPRYDACGIEDAFTGRFDEYAPPPGVWDAYVQRFARELATCAPPALRGQLRLAARLRSAGQARRGAAQHVERLLASLGGA